MFQDPSSFNQTENYALMEREDRSYADEIGLKTKPTLSIQKF